MHESVNRSRPVQQDIPPQREMRQRLREVIVRYVADERIPPPPALEELRTHAAKVLRLAGLEQEFARYAAVMLSNEIWRGCVAGIPFSRRLLLLPRCLRDQAHCRGQLDGVGLLCNQCGSCDLAGLQQLAQKLGYVVLPVKVPITGVFVARICAWIVMFVAVA